MQYDGINGRYVIPMAEVDAVEIRETANGVVAAGTGPEYCSAGKEDNPKWLMNHAVNCLALARRLERRESVTEQVAGHVVFMKLPMIGEVKIVLTDEQWEKFKWLDQKEKEPEPEHWPGEYLDPNGFIVAPRGVFRGQRRKPGEDEHFVLPNYNGDVMCCCGYNPHHRSSSREDDYRRVSAHIKDETKERK